MTPIMTRTFFPVGNGIFCLECFENRHAIAYDCGSTSRERVECRVSEFAGRNDIDVIDYVFVSHFHEDHVNGLPILLEESNVRRVVMPLMSEEDMYLLWLGRQLRQPSPNVIPDLDSGDFVDELILDPAGAVGGYGEGTEVGFVAPQDNRTQGHIAPTENADNHPFRVDGMPRAQKAPQAAVVKDEITLETGESCECWRYVPFTIRYAEKADELKRGLAKLGIRLYSDVVDHVRKHGHKDIRDTYKKVTGSQFNLYSMAVYSYSPRIDLHQRVKPRTPSTSEYRKRIEGRKFKAPCLYLGDYEAEKDENWNDLASYFKSKTGHYPLDGLGCLQIPHHGSHHNFNNEFISEDFLSVIPAGFDRDHPSNKVLMKYIENNVTPYVVTDKDEMILELREIS